MYNTLKVPCIKHLRYKYQNIQRETLTDLQKWFQVIVCLRQRTRVTTKNLCKRSVDYELINGGYVVILDVNHNWNLRKLLVRRIPLRTTTRNGLQLRSRIHRGRSSHRYFGTSLRRLWWLLLAFALTLLSCLLSCLLCSLLLFVFLLLFGLLSASLTFCAFFLSDSARFFTAFSRASSSSMASRSTISTADTPRASLDCLRSISWSGVNVMLQSRYHAPELRCAVVHVRNWAGENMQASEERSIQVVRNTGRSSLAIAFFGKSSYLKYLHKKQCC